MRLVHVKITTRVTIYHRSHEKIYNELFLTLEPYSDKLKKRNALLSRQQQQQQQQQHSTKHHRKIRHALSASPTLGLSIDTGRLSVFLGGSFPLTEDAADGVIATRGLVLPLPTPTLADARVPMLPMLT